MQQMWNRTLAKIAALMALVAPAMATTIIDTPGLDRLSGTPGDDVIAGLAGADVIFVAVGNDTL